jgi:hypothetical protein
LLFYVPGAVDVERPRRSLVWVDRKGHEERIRAPLRDLNEAAGAAADGQSGDS